MRTCTKCKITKPEDEFSWQITGTYRQSKCKLCVAEYNHAYYERNQEAVKCHVRERAHINVDAIAEKNRKYRELNRDVLPARRREQRERNIDRERAKRRQRYRDNPEEYKMHSRKRKALKKAAPGSYSPAEWRALKLHYQGTCLRCKLQEPEIKLVPDHVIPLSKGGADDITNIQPLCEKCNSWKFVKTIDFR